MLKIMKKVFNLLKRAGKAYYKNYMKCVTVELEDGRTVYINACGTACIA